MYRELSEKIERTSNLLHLLTEITFVGTNIPASLITVFSYFVLDLKEESFFLPYPTMCVIGQKRYEYNINDCNGNLFTKPFFPFLGYHLTGKRHLDTF